MTNKTPSDRRPFPALRSLLLAAAVLLAGCAPGSGGTGTGPTHAFGGTVILATTTAGGGGHDAGIPPATVTCSTVSVPVSVQAQEGRITLTTPCASFEYMGEWAANEQGQVQVTGTYETLVPAFTQEATVRLDFSAGVAGSTEVIVTLIDSVGVPVLGPVVLQRTVAP